ncbi:MULTISPECIES: bifunctional phosphopantothenoylcysteine decarboxylase/phosphopantothenate--cysteine ligase CoaBC [unclassified Sphingomonas]|jgi:phosphopantothenoylcysteine decarboxylase/phosphopantothenate--cysteine ligase|uniref:bifunctional phosphopantothenoylcysteine decarboxylase/phosphopantothenate--cysteine ligase CoaBC n=1 Tax=unclassified Sphingomonas TaxID=196159 RepID=UPI0025D92C7C|nr:MULTISPECIES: bifunctional phosphopantothenoylcysteine decarboxylase/phosphopantothenate--cysteine ligase CoaBC [unclassified Sphingomonas]
MKRVLLVVGGGIAAYKAAELIRLLRKRGHAVRCVLTEGASHFVTPMTLAALSEDKVYTTLWDLKDEAEMGHIQLSRQADLIVVAPATADLMARMAAGIADDLATTLLLATDTPVLAAPAMNVRMWAHPATQRNVAQLRADGITVLDPDEGAMACGEYGPGRLPEPAAIAAEIDSMLTPAAGPLAGRHVLVTAGPTHEPIDPVRYIANRSSGRQGFAIADALAGLGARVTLVAGPVALATPAGVTRVDVVTAQDMADAVARALPADAAVMVAAVADWRVDAAPQKVKKGDATPALTLTENVDILATVAASDRRPRLVVGFAAETERVVEHATAKRLRKGADWIVANDVSGDVFGGDANTVHLATANGVEHWERLPKEEVARRLAQRIADALISS